MISALAILLTGMGTFLCRSLFVVALSGRRLPPLLLRAMEYVAPAVMAALVVSLLVESQQPVSISAAQFGGLGCAVLVAWRTRNHIVTLCAAMAVFWLLG